MNTSGEISMDMNNLPPSENRVPRGGKYVETQGVTNLSGAEENVIRVRMFDAAYDTIVIDGQPLGPDNIPANMTIFDGDGSMVALFGGDGAIILRGIPLEWWAAGARRQQHGTAGRDCLYGNDTAEVFAPGGGFDTIAPGGGDDRINFAFDDLIILSDPPNLCVDTLDLRRFSTGQIGMLIEGYDAVISTPNGTIRVQDQFRELLGGNIERILLADEQVLSMADMRRILSPDAQN